MSTDAESEYVAHPGAESAVLAQIAARRADLQETIARHPNAYDGLLDWLIAYGTPAAGAAASQRRAPADGTAEPIAGLGGSGLEDTSATAEPAGPAQRRRRKRIIGFVAAVGAVVVIVGGFATVSGVQQQAADARSAFESSSAALRDDADALVDVVSSATALLQSTPPDAVADPAVLEELQKLVDQANSVDSVVPPIADTTDAIRAQASSLTDRAHDIYLLGLHVSDAMDTVAASKQARAVERVVGGSEHVVEAVDGNGNRERITIRIGSWARGSDAELLQEAWASIGGDGQLPLLGDPDGFTASDGAVVMGTVMIENLTPDFPAENFAGGQAWVYLTPLVPFDGLFAKWRDPSFEGLGATLQVRQYSSGASVDQVSGGNPLIRAAMSTNKWGPVPFAIGIDTVFTPNDPGGDPKLDAIRFAVGTSIFAEKSGDVDFQIGRTW